MGFCPSNELLIIVETVRNLGHYRTFVTQIPGLMSGYWLAVAGGGSFSLQLRGGGWCKTGKVYCDVCMFSEMTTATSGLQQEHGTHGTLGH